MQGLDWNQNTDIRNINSCLLFSVLWKFGKDIPARWYYLYGKRSILLLPLFKPLYHPQGSYHTIGRLVCFLPWIKGSQPAWKHNSDKWLRFLLLYIIDLLFLAGQRYKPTACRFDRNRNVLFYEYCAKANEHERYANQNHTGIGFRWL